MNKDIIDKFYIIAGEQSGDFIGSKLINSIKDIWERKSEFYGVGGDLMKLAKQEQIASIQQLNIMGFTEVILHIPRIYRLISEITNDILEKDVNVLITIDSPALTFRIAKKIKELAPNTKIIHIVAPSVWAYKESRAKKYAEIYDHLFTLLPFEPKYFIQHGLDTHFIGHPIFEQDFYRNSKYLRESMNIFTDAKIIVVTPGSRESEIKRHMRVLKDTLDLLAEKYKILAIFVQNNSEFYDTISSFLVNSKFEYIFSTEKLKSFAVADCALAKSGTNSLEISASLTPMVIYYKINFFSYLLIKSMIKIKFVNLVNILSGKSIIAEYLQSDCTPINLAKAIIPFLECKNKENLEQVKDSVKILEELGLNRECKPSKKAAEIIASIIF